MRIHLLRRVFVGLALLGSGVALRAQLSSGQNLLGDSFEAATSTAPVTTLTNFNTAGYPCLTAAAVPPAGPSTIANCGLAEPDPAGQGFLRFTAAAQDQASAIVYDTNIPTLQGLTITFKQYQWGGSALGGWGGADGIAFFLAVAPPQPTVLGPSGGALGYTSYFGADGLPGGWLGIGLDAFGNYSNSAFATPGGCTIPSWAGWSPNQIVVRGPGFGTDGYCLLSSSIELGANNPVGEFGAQLSGPDRASSERTIQVIVDPAAGTYTVNIDPAGGTNFVLATSGPLPPSYYDPVTGALVPGIPPRITFGFAASTGSATDVHEIRSLTTTANGNVPVLAMTKTNSLLAPPIPGDAFDYILTPSVAGSVAEDLPLSIRVSDTLPAGVTLTTVPTGAGWNCTTTSLSAFECAYTVAGSIPPGTDLPEITVPVVLDTGLQLGATLVNTATIVSTDAATSVNATNTVVLTSGLAVSTTNLPNGTVGVGYDQQLVATGGAPGYTWSIDSGSLPAGLTLAADGRITGTPTATGAASFTALVQDGLGASAVQPLTVLIVPPPLAVTTAALPSGTVGVAYTTTLSATGGVGGVTWSLDDGALPHGLSLTAAGEISGTPTTPGTFLFTVRATDTVGAFNAVGLAIQVSPPAVTVDTSGWPAGPSGSSALAGGTVGVAYTAALTATGGTGGFTWTLVGGALPAGLTLAPGGAISGTPTTAGVALFTVRATDSVGAFTDVLLSINVSPAPVTITTASLPDGQVGTAYSATLAASGGTGGFTWTLESGALPAGLTLAASGAITGTPTASGTANIVVRATDGASSSATRALAITINIPLAITVGTPGGPGGSNTLPGGTVGVAYSTLLAASGGTAPVSWSLANGAPPAGLSLATSGAITGIPTTPGTTAFTVRVTDGIGASATQLLSITITAPPVVVTTASLPGGTVGVPYVGATLAATGGTGSYTWVALSGLPAGLTLSPSGVISGTPTVAGVFTVSVQASDANTGVGTRQLPITIAGAALAIVTPATLPAGVPGVPYAVALAATGGTQPYAWSVVPGYRLPAGLTLSSAGIISGTPARREFSGGGVMIQVTGAAGEASTRRFFLPVSDLTIRTTSLPSARVGDFYRGDLSTNGGIGVPRWTIESGALPPGLALRWHGSLDGRPTTRGSFTFVARVTDGVVTLSRQFTIVIQPALLEITTRFVGAISPGVPYRFQLAATGGVGPYVWSLARGTLPPGFTLSPDGLITGTAPDAYSAHLFYVRVTDATGTTDEELGFWWVSTTPGG